MKITLEQIDLIRKRTGVSYSEAKDVLQMHDGDVVEALSYFEKNKKIKGDKFKECSSSVSDTIKKLIKKGFEIRLLVSKEDRVRLDASLNILILALVFAFPITVGLGILSVLTKHSIVFKSKEKEDVSVNEVIHQITDKVSNTINEI